MNGPPSRVAVQVGAHTVRLACAAVDDEPELIAERPGATGEVAQLLAELVGPGPEELVIVHPASWSAARLAACTGELAGPVGRVRAVPVPVAAATVLPSLVLDVGHTCAEVTRLGSDGSVHSCRSVPLGGARLDEWLVHRLRSAARRGEPADPDRAAHEPGRAPRTAAPEPSAVAAVTPTASELAAARRIRERLSLLPAVDSQIDGLGGGVQVSAAEVAAILAEPLHAVVDLLREVRGDEAPIPVLLIGGVARTPLLAELVDAAGWTDVTVAPRPDAAAVLGALRSASAVVTSANGRDPPAPHLTTVDTPHRTAAPRGGSVVDHGPAAGGSWSRPLPASERREAPVPRAPYFPAARRRPLRAAALALVAVGALAGLLVAGLVLLPPVPPVATPAGVLVQYGYRLDLPDGWEHTGGLPERRRVLLTPAAAPQGSEVIAVERTPLGYDSEAERPRALGELRAEFESAVAAGSALSGYRSETVASREVVRYEQRDPPGRPAVEWFVVLDGNAQFSVGCRHNPSRADVVRAACALVVGSVRRA